MTEDNGRMSVQITFEKGGDVSVWAHDGDERISATAKPDRLVRLLPASVVAQVADQAAALLDAINVGACLSRLER